MADEEKLALSSNERAEGRQTIHRFLRAAVSSLAFFTLFAIVNHGIARWVFGVVDAGVFVTSTFFAGICWAIWEQVK